jgi:hypothetical protein
MSSTASEIHPCMTAQMHSLTITPMRQDAVNGLRDDTSFPPHPASHDILIRIVDNFYI